MHRFKLLAILGIALIVLIAIVRNTPARGSTIFFRTQLMAIYGRELVEVDGRSVSIENGTITSRGDVALPQQAESYRLAYALELARRAPVLGIEGTDPGRLEANLDILTSKLDAVAMKQSTTKSAESIRTSLYPISFLRGLASAERARREFIGTPNRANEQAYERSIFDALAAGTKDIALFRAAYVFESSNASTTRFATFGGTISVPDMVAATNAIQRRMEEASSTEAARVRCLDGEASVCDPNALTLSVAVPDQTTPATPSTSDYRKLMADSGTVLPIDARAGAVLTKSVCLAEMPGPYPFLTPTPEAHDDFYPSIYLGDEFFSRVSAQAPVPAYIKSHYGISLLRVNPMVFYECPELGTDIGALQSVLSITAYARRESSLAANSRKILLDDEMPRGDHALTYLDDLVRQTAALQQPLPDDAVSLVLMTKQKSADLDVLVGQIASILDTDLRLLQSGVPMDLSAHNLFLTHSALPSLYLAQNESVGTSRVVLREQNDSEHTQLFEHYLRFSDIRTMMPYSALVEANRAMNEFETGLR